VSGKVLAKRRMILLFVRVKRRGSDQSKCHMEEWYGSESDINIRNL
jgi:hypothetical protein